MSYQDPSGSGNGPGAEWFARDRAGQTPGLSFACTMCGNCCTGPEGFVLVNDAEVAGLAARFAMSDEAFRAQYTHMTSRGLSLTETPYEGGFDCVFLDRTKFPGKAVCGVYENRPAQCRTWPFWKSNLVSRGAWERAKRTCPGMDGGRAYTPVEIRVRRDEIEM